MGQVDWRSQGGEGDERFILTVGGVAWEGSTGQVKEPDLEVSVFSD